MEKQLQKMRDFVGKLGLYGLLLTLLVTSFAIVNTKKTLKFWITGETDYNEWNVSLGNKGETDYISNFWGKIQFVNFNGLMRNILGQHEMNGVVKLNNGYLLTTFDFLPEEEIEERAIALKNFNDYLKSSDTKLLFAVTPYTSSKYAPQLPIGIDDCGNDNLDRLVMASKDKGVEVMDFRKVMYEEGIDQYSMMYKTDHHWTTQAGFYAYTKVLEWIKENVSVEVDDKVADLNNYTITTYPRWHLGSRGQRTGYLYAGIDDYDLILPKFDTMIQQGDKIGNYEEMMINYAPLKSKDYRSRYTYDRVMNAGGGINLNSENDLKILVVGDSFLTALSPYLVLSFYETRVVYAPNGVDKEYLEEYKPDVIVCLYYTGTVMNKDAFIFPSM